MLVLTSMNEHGSLARAALEAGRHVLVEKPRATSVQEATELLEAVP
ncbi:Gfo/Idh/MocA family oxidoreductase [Streptomyces sp. NPDC056653]